MYRFQGVLAWMVPGLEARAPGKAGQDIFRQQAHRVRQGRARPITLMLATSATVF